LTHQGGSKQKQREKHDEEADDDGEHKIHLGATGKVDLRDRQEPRDCAQRDFDDGRVDARCRAKGGGKRARLAEANHQSNIRH
jgi:hypothetical protein